MKLLALHVDYIKFKPLKKALKSVGELAEKEKKESKVGESLVILTAVEKGDSVVDSVKELVESVKDIAGQVKAKAVVLYPYAHLSSNLSAPELALEILEKAEKELGKIFEVTRAPFGYYKEFELKVKGHPLSELSRSFGSPDVGAISKSNVSVHKQVVKGNDENYDPKDFLHMLRQVKLDTSKLKSNDHRIVGQQMELFMFNDTSPGMPYWLPNGLTLYNELLSFWREHHNKLGYKEIMTPLINKKELYLISGHWDHYKENMFISHTEENETYAVKPMNCPNAMIVFRSQSRSYKDLPLRLSDTDRLHRFELSGTLNGLFRVRSFQQDDSHNFISEDMIKSEYEHILSICKIFYGVFGLDYSFRLGTRPAKFLGDKKTWDKAETMLKDVLKNSGKKFTVLDGDGAFYGPKVDIIMKDSQGREWQMGTVQLDFQLPQRFDLKYTDKDGKLKTPVVVHRVIYGSLERFIGVLLEHTNGRLPTWLAPIQVRVVSFTDRNEKYAQKVVKKLGEEIPNLRIDADFRNTTVQAKVKEAELMRVPYIVVVGDKEEKTGDVALRIRGDNKIKISKLDKFVKDLKKEIETRA